MNLTVVIIDDEPDSIDNLKYLIQKYGSDIKIIGTALNPIDGMEELKRKEPDILFLDIKMPYMSGFSLLEAFPDKKFSVIFITAYNQYAIKAIKANAVDYLLKPIDIKEFKQTMNRLQELHSNHRSNFNDSLKVLLNQLHESRASQKITLSSNKGLKIVDLNDIIYLKGENNYTHVFLSGSDRITVSRTLKDFEELPEEIFFRIHKSFIINLSHIKSYERKKFNEVLMSNGSTLRISRRRQKSFLQILKELYNE